MWIRLLFRVCRVVPFAVVALCALSCLREQAAADPRPGLHEQAAADPRPGLHEQAAADPRPGLHEQAAADPRLDLHEQAAADPRLGLNLEGNSYYSSEVTFVDAFKHSQPFFAQKAGAGWAESDEHAVVFGVNGYPRSIAPNHSAVSLWDVPRGYPRGKMVLLWEGKGDVAPMFLDNSAIASSKHGRVVFQLPEPITESARIGIEIKSTHATDPVRDIRLIPLAYERVHAKRGPGNLFRPEFLKRWSMMDGFRYMDWGATNDSKVSTWDSRPKPSDQTQGDRGVALEYQIAHANLTKAHPWFNIPHLATDEYVRKAAALIRDTLDAGLVARIEYSNEVWNDIFGQASYARTQAAQLPGQQADFAGQLRWYSKRSVEIFDIFTEVFTKNGKAPQGARRLVRVMAAQSANPWVARQVLEFQHAYRKVDALAIAPYFGAFPSAGKEAEQWKRSSWKQRLKSVERALSDAMAEMDAHKSLLRETKDSRGQKLYAHIQLFAYEGGQHFLGHPDTHEDAQLTKLMQQLSRRPEMRDYYFRYLRHWHQIGGADFMLFSSLIASSRHGSWGLIEYEGQPQHEAPKLQGVLGYLAWSKSQKTPAKAAAK